MQELKRGDKTVLVVDPDELRSHEAQAAAKAALVAGHGLTLGGLAIAKDDGFYVVSHGAEQHPVDKSADEIVNTIVAYKTPERILAVLSI